MGPEGTGHLKDIGERLLNLYVTIEFGKLVLKLEVASFGTRTHTQVDLAHRITSETALSQAACARGVLAAFYTTAELKMEYWCYQVQPTYPAS